jgi:hypothetical protein
VALDGANRCADEVQNIKAPLGGYKRAAGRASNLIFFPRELVSRLAPQPLYLILEFQFFLFQSPDFDVIRPGAGHGSIDALFECPVLFCEFCKMRRYRHQLPPKEIADVEIVPHVSRVVQCLRKCMRHV